MRSSFPLKQLIASLLCLTGSGIWGQEPKPRHSADPGAVLARIPEKARGKSNPVEDDPEAAAAGKKLFGQHCAECHGRGADGTKRGPSLQVEELQHATAGELFWILTNGVVRRGMPSWAKLPEPERWQIITFLRQLGAARQAGSLAQKY